MKDFYITTVFSVLIYAENILYVKISASRIV